MSEAAPRPRGGTPVGDGLTICSDASTFLVKLFFTGLAESVSCVCVPALGLWSSCVTCWGKPELGGGAAYTYMRNLRRYDDCINVYKRIDELDNQELKRPALDGGGEDNMSNNAPVANRDSANSNNGTGSLSAYAPPDEAPPTPDEMEDNDSGDDNDNAAGAAVAEAEAPASGSDSD